MSLGKYLIVAALFVVAPPQVFAQCMGDAGGRCAGDNNGDGTVQVNELIQSVNASLHGCGSAVCQQGVGANLGEGSITSFEILDGTITAVDLAPGIAVPLAEGSVTTTEILDGTITSVDLAPGIVIPLAEGSVTSVEIQDGTITEADLAEQLRPADVRVRAESTSQQIPTGSEVPVTVFDRVLWDTAGMLRPQGVFQVPVAGMYLIDASVAWASNDTQRRRISIFMNRETDGSKRITTSGVHSVRTSALHQSVSAVFELTPDDFVQLLVFQNTGGPLEVTNVHFAMTLLYALN